MALLSSVKAEQGRKGGKHIAVMEVNASPNLNQHSTMLVDSNSCNFINTLYTLEELPKTAILHRYFRRTHDYFGTSQ